MGLQVSTAELFVDLHVYPGICIDRCWNIFQLACILGFANTAEMFFYVHTSGVPAEELRRSETNKAWALKKVPLCVPVINLEITVHVRVTN